MDGCVADVLAGIAHCRELLQIRCAFPEPSKSSRGLAFPHMPRRIVGGRTGEQRKGIGPGERFLGAGGGPCQRRRLVNQQSRFAVSLSNRELAAQPEEHDRHAARHSLEYPAADPAKDRGVINRRIVVFDREGPREQRVGECGDKGLAALDEAAPGCGRAGEVDGDRACNDFRFQMLADLFGQQFRRYLESPPERFES